ncbi:TadE family type IV pilus minor pilin [Actinomadura sp. NPDC047616]|uniref:TadE family type IV pilus minor pilin n=1 Tax=Actinomadura sp. NPDC047616 TaxID=3155914 RepID=UPI0033CE292B
MVTAEIAVALPALVLVLVTSLWAVRIASTQVACTDAARSGARAAARGEPLPAVRAVVARALPPGAQIRISRNVETTRVDVAVPTRPPAVSGLPALLIRAHATAATEPGAHRQTEQ